LVSKGPLGHLVHDPTFALDEYPIPNHFGTLVQCFCPFVVHGANHEVVDQRVGLLGLDPESIFQEVGLSRLVVSSDHDTYDHCRMH
jgi:hypothetical protein